MDKYYSNSMIDYVYYDRNQREQYLGKDPKELFSFQN